MKYFRLVFLMLLLIFGLLQDTSADEIVLNNGQVIKGRIAEKNPERVKIEVFYGTINLERKEISSIEEVPLKLNYLFLAEGYESREDEDKAREYYNLVLELDPEYKEAKEALARFNEKTKAIQRQKQEKEKEILELNELALQENSRENYQDALDHLKKAYSLDNRNVLIKDNLVQVYLDYSWKLYREGEKDSALKLLSEATKVLPGYIEIPILSGEFYYRDEKLNQAVDIWEKAFKKSPSNQHLQSRLEEAQRRLKKTQVEIYYSDSLFQVKTPANLTAEEESLLNEIIEFFRKAGEDLGSTIYYYPPNITDIIVYGRSMIAPVISEGIMFNDKEIVISLPFLKNKSEAKINSRVIYVCTDLFLYSLMGDNCPLWMRKGFALYRSGVSYDNQLLKDAIEDKIFLKLRKIEDFLRNKRSGKLEELVNAECQSFIAFLINDFGERFLFDTFKEIAQGTDYEDALDIFFAWNIFQLEKQWVEWIEE